MGAERPDGAGAAPDVRLELTHGPDGPGVLADGRPLPVPPHASPTEVGLAATRRHAARSGRELRVEVVDGSSVTLVTVGRHGAVTLLEPPATASLPAVPAADPDGPATVAERTAVHLPPVLVPTIPPPTTPAPTTPPLGPPPTTSWTSAWAPAPGARPRRPVSSLVVAGLVAVAVLVGAVGTGVATRSSSQALPDSCRPVTLYAVGGQGGSADVLRGVTDPLAKQFGEKVSVVTVPAPSAGGSFASAESHAVGSLATAVGEHVDGCPTGSLMLFGYSQGAQAAGDLASRIGTGLEPRIPATLVQAVGLFGDPARSPRTRAVPDGTTGQGALPPRAVGFGSLDARTIEICAPGDPVCDSPPTAAAPPLEQAVASPVHASYEKLPVAAGTTAPQWAAASLGKVVAAIPTDTGPAKTPGTAPQSGSGGTTAAEDPDTTGTADPTTRASGAGTGPSGSRTSGSASGSTGTRTSGTDAGAVGSGAAGDAGAAGPGGGGDAGAAGSGTAGEAGAAGSGTAGEAGEVTTTPPARGTGATGDDGGYGSGASGVTPTTAPSGSVATGASGDGAGVSTRRSGAASDGEGPSPTSSPSGTRSGAGGEGASGTGSSGAGSTRSGSTGTKRTTSSAPGSSRSSGSASEEPTTTSSATSSRKGGSAATTTRSSGKPGKDSGKDTGAAFSLTGGLAGFKSTPWNNQGATDPSPAESPNVPGRKAVKFEMPGGGKRTEAEPDIPEFTDGEKAFIGYSGFFDQGFPTNTDTWQLIMQFKQPGTGSPPLAVEVGKGQLRLANDGGSEKDFCPVTQGAFSFQLGVTFGGAIDAWCNGKQTLTGYTTPKPNVQGSAYLKTGIYRDEAIRQDSTLFLNDLKVGTTLESVSGLAGAGSASDAGTTTAGTDPGTGGAQASGTEGTGSATGSTPARSTTAGSTPAGSSRAESGPAGSAAAGGPGAPAVAAGAVAPGGGAGSSGPGSGALDPNAYFSGAGGAPPPGERPPRTGGS